MYIETKIGGKTLKPLVDTEADAVYMEMEFVKKIDLSYAREK